MTPELRDVLIRWWEDFHYAELLTLPGFLWARRGHLVGPNGAPPIVTMYGLTEPAAADQPRPPEFTLLPSELDGKVTFNRRILTRVSPTPGAEEPTSPEFLQMLRVSQDAAELEESAERVRQWPRVRSVSTWRTVPNDPHTSRQEVVHLGDTELIHVEVDSGADPAADMTALLELSTGDVPGWNATGYRQASFQRPSRTTSPS